MPREPAARQMLRLILPLYREKKWLCSRRKPGMILPVSESTKVHPGHAACRTPRQRGGQEHGIG
eukprot:2349044-Rhodomonas_salina.1